MAGEYPRKYWWLVLVVVPLIAALIPILTRERAKEETPAAGRTLELELEYWNSIEDSTDPDAFKAYLEKYPNGQFSDIAKIELNKLLRPPGTLKENAQDGLQYVWIPSGSFEMGCVPGDDACAGGEKPRHPVDVTEGFWITRTEVTVGAYKRFVASKRGRKMPPEPGRVNRSWKEDTHPIVFVTWDEARAFCRWAGGGLPTEAEWEYAARGGKEGLKYPWGNEITHDDANYFGAGGRDNYYDYTAPVGSFPPNAFGLYGMVGNAAEWCGDWYAPDYYKWSEVRDPKGPPSGEYRVVRGGSWASHPRGVRVSGRVRYPPVGRNQGIGFRCVREVIP